MGQPRVKWGDVKLYLERNGYEIRHHGGDKIIVGPPSPGSRRQTVRIGHTSSRNAGTELLRVYVSQLKRVFGINIDDLLD